MELWRSANFLSFFMSTAAKRSGDISVLVMSLVMWRNRNGFKVQGAGFTEGRGWEGVED